MSEKGDAVYYRGSRRPLPQSLLAAHFDQLCAARLSTFYNQSRTEPPPLARRARWVDYRGSPLTESCQGPPPPA